MAGSRQLQVAVWVVAVLAILNAGPLLESVIGRSHNICGVWGCGAPLSSLIVWHGFVAFVLVPLSAVAARVRPLVAQRWGRAVLVLAILLSTAYAVCDVVVWWNSAAAFARGFILHRLLFSLVAFTDAPVLPVVSAAAVYWWVGRKTPASGNTAEPFGTEPSSADPDGLLPSSGIQITE